MGFKILIIFFFLINPDSAIFKGEENTDINLKPAKSGKPAECTEKNWFKYEGPHHFPRIAHLESDNTLLYFGEFCSKRTEYSCKESQRLELNTDTGDLKIRNVQLSDEDDYYYFCGIENKWPAYELMRLEVQGK